MALPIGYKLLEYIESTGTQYINTGFKPNQDTRVVLKYGGCAESAWTEVFGAGTSSSSPKNNFLIVQRQSTGVQAQYGTKYYTASATSDGAIIDLNKNLYYVNGVLKHSFTYTEFATPYSMYLFDANVNNSYAYSGYSGKIYYCQIYDNGTLVRDFIPCQKPDGTIGLWDDVNSVFYGNAGTGTFTAGPVAVVIPEAPPNLRQTMAVRLAWAEVSGAEQYNVYRDGTLLATTTDLAYVDDTAAENTEYTYGVSAVNSAGESPKTTIPIYTKSGYFLYKPYVESATFQ